MRLLARRDPQMVCQELVETITAYLEGALSRRERRRFEAHLAGCDACREYVAQLRAVIAASGRLRASTLALDERERLLEAFHGWLDER